MGKKILFKNIDLLFIIDQICITRSGFLQYALLSRFTIFLKLFNTHPLNFSPPSKMKVFIRIFDHIILFVSKRNFIWLKLQHQLHLFFCFTNIFLCFSQTNGWANRYPMKFQSKTAKSKSLTISSSSALQSILDSTSINTIATYV